MHADYGVRRLASMKSKHKHEFEMWIQISKDRCPHLSENNLMLVLMQHLMEQ